MIGQSYDSLKARVLKTFPERQFFHRTGGEVNFFVLGTRAQLLMVALAAVLALWCLFTIFNVIWGQSPLRSASKELRIKEAQYERYLVDARAQEQDARTLLEEQQRQFELAAKDFQDKHNAIVTMLTQGGIAQTPEDVSGTSYAHTEVMMAPTMLDPLPRKPRSSFQTLQPLQTGTVLDASLVNLELDQNDILSEGEEKMQARIEHNRAIINATGLAMNDILANGSQGMGGPFIALDGQPDALRASEFLPRMSAIKARAYEVEALNKVVAAMPLGYPVDAENYRTSDYGRRSDPFTKRPTRHLGVDIASYRSAPIIATADGKVTFSGVRDGFGRVVEIDHGYGFVTRYAHLEKSYVKRGQKVEKGEKIAGMGSSGRSTSTHVHYEVMFEKRQQNPDNFLKAGQYVQ